MSKMTRNVLLLAKIEVTPGTDPVPTAGVNAMLVELKNVQPLRAETTQRNLTRPYFGASGTLTVGTSSQIEFDVELASSGAAGTAPAFKDLLLACATSETVSAGVSATYAPVTSPLKTVTIYYYLDGILHKFIGCKGSAQLNVQAKSIPKISFSFQGTYTAPTDTALPSGASYTAFKDPKPVNSANTPTLTLHSVALISAGFSLDFGNALAVRNLIGLDEIAMTDRSTTGSVTFEATSVAAKAWHEAVRNNSTGAFALTHGTGAGNIIELTASKVQISDISYSEDTGVQMMQTNLTFLPTTGGDEFSLVFK